MVTSPTRRAADATSAATMSRGVVVRRPRTRDAIGLALRQSFDDVAHVPDEFAGYLHQLDRISSAR